MITTVNLNDESVPIRATAPDEVARALRAAGLRPTAQRRAVLTMMMACARALTAPELHDQLRRDGYAVSLNTAYRTLGALAGVGAIHTFAREGEIAFRWCSANRHLHLICDRCGRVEDVSADGIDGSVASLARSAGYTVRGHRTDVYGTCSSC